MLRLKWDEMSYGLGEYFIGKKNQTYMRNSYPCIPLVSSQRYHMHKNNQISVLSYPKKPNFPDKRAALPQNIPAIHISVSSYNTN